MMKKMLIVLATLVFFAVAVTLMKIKDFSAFIYDIESLLFITYGGAIHYQGISFYRMLVAVIPFIVQAILFIDFVSQDIATVSTYIFTRTKRRWQWLLRRLAQLFLTSLLYHTAYYIISIAIGFFTGLAITDYEVFVTTLGLLYLTAVAWSTLFMLAIAVFTVKLKPSLVLSTAISSFIIWIFALPLLPKEIATWLVPLMPMSHVLLAAHDLTGVFDLSGFIGERAFSMTLMASGCYLVAGAIILLVGSCLWISKIDFFA